MDGDGPSMLYHEKQYGSMCGQHCLNNLLQAPYFKAEDLADIALELDRAERELMQVEEGEHKSNNVDDAGNFSIQVLSTALQRSHSLSLLQDAQALTDVLEALDREELSLDDDNVAFVCNLANHWFAIRSIAGKFWNLNSLKARPEKISLFYLSAYLGQLREEGYSIFVVRGDLPKPVGDLDMGDRKDWFVFGVDGQNVPEPPKRESVHTQDPDEDAQLQAVLRASMRSGSSLTSLAEGDDELQAAIALSLHNGGPVANDEDADLQAALALSRQDA